MAQPDIDPLERAAYHEAGHVALWRRFDRPRFVAKGEIRFTSTGNPHTRVTRSVHGVRESPAPSEHWMAVMAMACRVAEALRYPEMQASELGRLSGPDEEDARRMLREMHGADPDPKSAGTVGDAELWGGLSRGWVWRRSARGRARKRRVTNVSVPAWAPTMAWAMTGAGSKSPTASRPAGASASSPVVCSPLGKTRLRAAIGSSG